jgi:triosephosphate isomerase
MARTPVIAGNWKMHLDHLAAVQLVQQLSYRLRPADYDAAEIAVMPPFTALRSIQTVIEGDRLSLQLGAQDTYYEAEGAFTGAVSPAMLSKLTCRYVVCGHSERRTVFNETDDVINAKVKAVFSHSMTPVLCVGESLAQREAGDATSVVTEQLAADLAGVGGDQAGELVVAYEPVWAIGTGHTATPADAQEMGAAVRQALADLYDQGLAEGVRILYGGSVKPGNVKALTEKADVDGALVGGASVDAEDFAAICRAHHS